jgi:hypothetical protein
LRLLENVLVLYSEAMVRHSVIQQRQKSFVHDHLQDLSGGVILRSIVKIVKDAAEWNDLLKTKFNLNFIWSFSSYCSVNDLPFSYKTTRLMLHNGVVDLCCKNIFLFFAWLDSHSEPRPLHYWGFKNTLRRTTFGSTRLDEWSARRRDLYMTTHNTHKTQKPRTGGIRTCYPNKRAASDSRLSPHDHRDRL